MPRVSTQPEEADTVAIGFLSICNQGVKNGKYVM